VQAPQRPSPQPYFAAAVFAPRQVEVVAQDAEQWPLLVGVDAPAGAVDVQFRDVRHSGSSFPSSSEAIHSLLVLTPWVGAALGHAIDGTA
jgi:hypothetical protein